MVAGGCAVGEAAVGSSLLPGGKTAAEGDGGRGGVAGWMWRRRQLEESPQKWAAASVTEEVGGEGCLLAGGGGGQCATDQRARGQE